MSSSAPSSDQSSPDPSTSSPQNTKKPAYKKFSGFSSLPLEVYLKQLYAGGISGCIAKSFVCPLERVKFMYQVRNPMYNPEKNGIIRTLISVYKNENIYGFYKGNISSMLRVFPYASLNFSSYENALKFFGDHIVTVDPVTGQLPYWVFFFSGAFAGCTAVCFTYPLDLLRLRMALQFSTQKYTGVFDAAKRIVREEGGFLALFKGMRASLLGVFLYSGTNFFTYSSIKKFYSIHVMPRPSDELPKTVTLIAGCCAGVIGQSATYPIDVVRRRLQLSGYDNPDFKTHHYKYNGVLHGIKQIYKTEGWKALYRGLSLNWIKAAPLTGISFTVFEFMKKQMGIRREKPKGSE